MIKWKVLYITAENQDLCIILQNVWAKLHGVRKFEF